MIRPVVVVVLPRLPAREDAVQAAITSIGKALDTVTPPPERIIVAVHEAAGDILRASGPHGADLAGE